MFGSQKLEMATVDLGRKAIAQLRKKSANSLVFWLD